MLFSINQTCRLSQTMLKTLLMWIKTAAESWVPLMYSARRTEMPEPMCIKASWVWTHMVSAVIPSSHAPLGGLCLADVCCRNCSTKLSLKGSIQQTASREMEVLLPISHTVKKSTKKKTL